jgi:methyl-accepting chemotaxis protein
MEKLRNLTIQKKFRALIVFTILLTILNFVKDYYSTKKENGYLMAISVLEARRAEKDFFARKEVKYINKVKENINLVIEIAKNDGGEISSTIVSEMEIYLTNFMNSSNAETELGLDENSGIRGAFRKSVHSLEEIINTANMLQLEVDMLSIRRSEKDYIIRGSEKYITKVNKAISKLVADTKTSNLTNDKKESINELVNRYSENFRQYVDVRNKRNKYITIYTEHAHTIAPIIAEFQHEKHTIVQAINILFNIFVVLIVIVVYIFSKMIISRLKRVTDFAIKVEGGNLDDSLNDETLDEIGLLSRSFDKMVEKIGVQISYLDNLPTPITIMDNNFNVEYINKHGASLVGADQNNLDGVKCYDLFKTDHCNTAKCAVAQAMQKSSTVTEETTARPLGNEMEIMYTGAPVKDKAGNVVGALEYVADITEMKERENYLERSTEAILGAMNKFSQGDLTATVTAERDGDAIAKLFNGFNTSVANIKNMIEQVKEAVEATASASTQISSSAEEMAAGAQEQSAQTAEVAAAMEEMSRTVVETAANATNSAEASRSASEKANEGAEKLNASKAGMQQIVKATDTVGTNISSLASKTDQIGEIAQVIDDIADQTNLLALNAAIEAARAGEQGRGFAVVADEVRKLAERTTKATKEIAETIKAIQVEAKEANSSMEEAGVAVKSGMELNDEVGVVLTDILESVDDVSQQINQVAAASEEQSATAEQVSSNIESINNVANESAAVVQQIASASEDLNRLTENLSELVQQFHIDNRNSAENFGLIE